MPENKGYPECGHASVELFWERKKRCGEQREEKNRLSGAEVLIMLVSSSEVGNWGLWITKLTAWALLRKQTTEWKADWLDCLVWCCCPLLMYNLWIHRSLFARRLPLMFHSCFREGPDGLRCLKKLTLTFTTTVERRGWGAKKKRSAKIR